jgi:CRISPR-associated protein Cas5d
MCIEQWMNKKGLLAPDVRLSVRGKYALFPRPEFRHDLVTYETLTPVAARGILDHIHWRPAIRWIVDRIYVLAPIRTVDLAWDHETVRRAIALQDVHYVLDAHFLLTERAGPEDSMERHAAMFARAAAKADKVMPFLGHHHYRAEVEVLQSREDLASSERISADLGWMLYDFDFAEDRSPIFFRANVENGVLQVPPPNAPGLMR